MRPPDRGLEAPSPHGDDLRHVRPAGATTSKGPSPTCDPKRSCPASEMIGAPHVNVKIQNVSTWQINQAWATQYSKGRVFCGGDAVHRHPPSSGLGSNTSIQDAFNLAYVVKSWAGPQLLETYSDEHDKSQSACHPA